MTHQSTTPQGTPMPETVEQWITRTRPFEGVLHYGVSLAKPTDGRQVEQVSCPGTKIPQRPWYPLVGHRVGLAANSPVALASAFWILANEGGTAHRSWEL